MEQSLTAELEELRSQSSPALGELPGAAELLNQYKAVNPKTKVTFADLKAILALLP